MQLTAPIFKLKRQAKLLSKGENIPLHKALDQLAIAEGFRSWSHLSSAQPKPSLEDQLLSQFRGGELILLAARPGHGKTVLGLQLALAAAKEGRHSSFFSLEYTPADIFNRFSDLGFDPKACSALLDIDTSDDINASHIISRISAQVGTAFVVVDYLQLLDQKRSNPPLDDQLRLLKKHVVNRGGTIVLLSQIDRRFEASAKQMPDQTDIRLPNAIDLGLLDRACFLHEGQIQVNELH